MLETIITTLIMAAATIAAALITARAYKNPKRKQTENRSIDKKRLDKVRNLLLDMDNANVKAPLNAAIGEIGKFDFPDITATELEPWVQALICKGSGEVTGRWARNEEVKTRVSKAILAPNVSQLKRLLGRSDG